VEGQSGGGAEWRPEGRWCFEVRLSAQKRPRRRMGRRSGRWRERVAEGRCQAVVLSSSALECRGGRGIDCRAKGV
jgi:hypothetical protein